MEVVGVVARRGGRHRPEGGGGKLVPSPGRRVLGLFCCLARGLELERAVAVVG